MIYGLILRLRHLAYDKGWKKSYDVPVPTICVGNVSVGGTGKTPHTEMILRKLLAGGFENVAVLSRGYKRKSKGFLAVNAHTPASASGDEPLQIARKFPGVSVAVDKDRIQGCQKLEGASVIVLDDAFQYRRLRARLNIVLVDWNRPVFHDRLIPWGRLRDLPSRIRRAEIVIVTKCPSEVSDLQKQEWRRNLRLQDSQKLFFTTIAYEAPVPVFPEADVRYTYSHGLLLVSGIANDAPLRGRLSDDYKILGRLAFPDHHNFSKRDIKSIAAASRKAPTACIMTTEKDAQRLRDLDCVPREIRERLFCMPISARFISSEEEDTFTSLITQL